MTTVPKYDNEEKNTNQDTNINHDNNNYNGTI